MGILGVGQEEGLFLPTVTTNANPGTVWIGGYGSFERHDLVSPDDTMIVDNGIFLACPNYMSYQVVQLGRSWFSSLAGGEGLGMQFKGPGIVYTQSKNFNEFAAFMSKQLPSNGNQSSGPIIQSNIGQGIGNALSSWMSQGGAKKTRKKK